MRYQFSTALEDMDLEVIHAFLSKSYWAKGIPLEVLTKALENSLNFGLFENQRQLAFGRFITDRATFAYLADVFVLQTHRRQGLGKLMIEQALQLPDMQGLRRITLATQDAHALYEQFGFEPLSDPDIFMQRWNPDVYSKG